MELLLCAEEESVYGCLHVSLHTSKHVNSHFHRFESCVGLICGGTHTIEEDTHAFQKLIINGCMIKWLHVVDGQLEDLLPRALTSGAWALVSACGELADTLEDLNA